MTSTYIDKKEQSEEPAQRYSQSSDQTQADQAPLLTTKNYRGPTEESAQVYRATLDQVWVAASKALSQLKASVTNSTRAPAGGEIEGRWVGGQPLTLHVEQIEATSIRVKVRVGQFGDRKAEDAIQAGIRENL